MTGSQNKNPKWGIFVASTNGRLRGHWWAFGRLRPTDRPNNLRRVVWDPALSCHTHTPDTLNANTTNKCIKYKFCKCKCNTNTFSGRLRPNEQRPPSRALSCLTHSPDTLNANTTNKCIKYKFCKCNQYKYFFALSCHTHTPDALNTNTANRNTTGNLPKTTKTKSSCHAILPETLQLAGFCKQIQIHLHRVCKLQMQV